MKVAIAILLLSIAVAVSASNWALLVAGSNSYGNYRHQADVSHAYQILTKKGGFPAANVVTMMFDDIANNPSNPIKGQIFNKPGGPDVYGGVVIDYKGNDVNAANFLKVLGGDKASMTGIGSGKVIESTSEDNVFIFYSDHGAFGLVAMPTGPYLYATDLNKTLQTMVDQKKFKKLVFYLEACEAGSMFDKITPDNANIWAVTASNPNESSYAFYYNSTLNAYLGDEFSIHWMEDSDVSSMAADYSLEKQFEAVQALTKLSHVTKYGQTDMSTLPIAQFQTFNKVPGSALRSNIILREEEQSEEHRRVDAREIEIAVLRHQIKKSSDPVEKAVLKAALEKEIADRDRVDRVFRQIVHRVTSDREVIEHPYKSPRDFACLKTTLDDFEDACGVMSAYGLKYVRTLSALCDHGFKFERIHPAIRHVCHHSA